LSDAGENQGAPGARDCDIEKTPLFFELVVHFVYAKFVV
jgi:hypothetical protein